MPTPAERLAALATEVGVGVAPGQTVVVSASLGQEPLARAVAAAAYARGAHQVQVDYRDPHVQRARLLHAPEEAIGEVIPWIRERPRRMAELRCAWIGLSGPTELGLLDDVDPERIGRDTPSMVEWGDVVDRGEVAWAIIPGPSEGWARRLFGADEQPLATLWRHLERICRLDASDPAAAWRKRDAELTAAAARLTDARLDALRFRGPGTDLEIGLIAGTRWEGGATQTAWGVSHIPNLPTEEVFTSPDAARTHGTVTSTMPLIVSERRVTGLRIEFAEGRAVRVDADEGADVVRGIVGRDANAGRLGEVALVDASGRVGESGTVFESTLLDENAASHIALGTGFPSLADGADALRRVNSSGVHVDFMVGGPGVEVHGVTADGREVPVLVGGEWALR